MATKKSALGPLGSKFFSLMQARRQTLVRQGDLRIPLGLTPSQEHTLLKRLTANGYLFRLQRGVFLVPKTLPTGGFWRPNDYYIIDQYMKVLGAKYYIGGFSAIYYHGLTQQMPNQFTIYNDKFSGNRHFGKLAVSFIKIRTKHIAGYTTITIPNYETTNIATKERALLDLIQDWSRYRLLEEAFAWLEQDYQADKFLRAFIRLTVNHANQNTIRRIGYYLEKLGVSSKKLKPLLKQLNIIKAYVFLLPNLKNKGKKDKKWRIIDNAK